MSIKIVDSCDLYSDAAGMAKKGWVTTTVPPTHVATGGATGAGYVSCAPNQYLAHAYAESAYTKLSFWFRLPSMASSAKLITMYDSPTASADGPTSTGVYHGSLQVLTDGSFAAYGENNTLIANSAIGLVQANTWHHLEVIFYLNNSGFWDLYFDGASIGKISGDTYDSGYVGSTTYLGSSLSTVHFDDIIVDKSTTLQTVLGAYEINTLFTDSDTAQADYVGSYLDIDDPVGGADGDTTAVTSSTLNAESRFGFTALPSSETILMVNHVVEHRKSDAGVRSITPFVLSGATRSDGAEVDALEAFNMDDQLLLTDPNTAAAWTKAAVDALEAGFKLTV